MLKVVIADDEEKICNLLKLLVDWESLGFEIAAFAHNGLEALECVKEYQPEVIITDIQMPALSGLEMLERLREAKEDIDILVISGYREFEYARKALQYGAENYLLKPIKRAELTTSLMNIRQRREDRAAEQEKMEQNENFLRQSKAKLHQALMEDILKGSRQTLTPAEANRDYRCGFTGNAQSFMMIKSDYLDEMDEKALDIVQLKNKNSVAAILDDAGISSCSIIRGNLLLFYLDAPVADLDRVYQRSMRSIRDFAGRDSTVHVTVGAADVTDHRVFRAALECSRAAMEQLFLGRDRVIIYDPSMKAVKPLSPSPEFLQKIHDCLLAFANAELQKILQEWLHSLRQGQPGSASGESVYRSCAAVTEQIFFHSQLINKTADFSGLNSKYSLRLRMCGRWQEYEQYLSDLSSEITSYLQDMQTAKERKPVTDAKQIIRERYHTQLSLEEISSELGLNRTYFSGMFKKETGMTVSEYIASLRIEKAKQLLTSTGESMQQIADQIGYEDEKYFLRKFKKETGLTPGEYRKLYG